MLMNSNGIYRDNYEIPIDIIEDFFNSNNRRRKYYDTIKYALAQTPSEIREAKVYRIQKDIFNQLNSILTQDGIGAVIRNLRNQGIEYQGEVNLAHLDEYLDDISRYVAYQRL